MSQVDLRYIHQSIMQRFSVLIKRERLAHAYLFFGSKGVGKSQTALALAKLINCMAPGQAQACDRCESCIKIDAQSHPDIHYIHNDDHETIKIDQVRDVIQQTHLRPYEAAKKVFIICDVERMTNEAGNALLKTLEEPSKNSLIVLTTSVPEANLDTIRSRCQTVFFPRMASNELAQTLQSDYDIEHSLSLYLAKSSEGSLGKAVSLSGKKAVDFKNKVIDQFVLSPDAADYIKKISADRAATSNALEVLWSFFRDVLMCYLGKESAAFIHQDRIPDIRAVVQRYQKSDIIDILREIINTLRMAKDNFNVKIGLSLIKEMI